METVQQMACTVERGEIPGGPEAYPVYVQAHWMPFFDCFHILGRAGYDLESESADFHFAWYEETRTLLVYHPYRWIVYEPEYMLHRGRFEYIREEDAMRQNAVPYYRFPHTKDGTTLLEILGVLFQARGGLPQRIVLL